MTPLEAIRKNCLWCCLDQPLEVHLCGAINCPVHPLRYGKKLDYEGSVLKGIVAKCKECNGDEAAIHCQCTDCALYPFRLGNNPARTGIGRFKKDSDCSRSRGVSE